MAAAVEFDGFEPGIRQWVLAGQELSQHIAGLASSDLVELRAAMRELSDKLAAGYTQVAPDAVAIGDELVATDHGGVLVRWYRPAKVPAAAPTMVYAHGGAFLAGSVHELVNDRLMAQRAYDAGIQIASVDYRLAPEHPYPAAVEDVMGVVSAIAADPRRFDTDPARLGVGGTSAGAAIVASAALRLRDEGGPALAHQMLEVVPAALRLVGESGQLYAHGYGLDGLELVAPAYLANGKDAYAEPLDVEDLSGLPPTLIMVAEFDPLRDSGLAYAQRLRDAGVAVTTYFGEGHVHASMSATAVSPRARQWNSECAREVALAYGTNVQ